MRKLNIGFIVVLLVFQTLLSPISVFASEGAVEEESPTEEQAVVDQGDGEGTETGTGDQGDKEETETGTGDQGDEEGTETGTGDQGDGEGTETGAGNQGDGEGTETGTGDQGDGEGTETGTGDQGDGEGTETGTGNQGEGTETGTGNQGEGTETDTEDQGAGEETEIDNGELMDVKQLVTEEPITAVQGNISATLSSFKMMIDGEEVTVDYDKELDKDTTAKFEVTFDVVLDKLYAAGSSFEFPLPKSLIDFDNAFKGSKSAEDNIAYSYSTTNNIVKVVLDKDMKPEYITDHAELTMNFTAGFKDLSNELEQEIEIPTTGSGTEKITLKFLPETSGLKTTKVAIGKPQPLDGNHQMEWEVWVNKASKLLNGATLEDNPGTKHKVIKDTISVEQYEVKLDGDTVLTNDFVFDKEDVIINPETGGFTLNLADGRYAYKVTYKTVVNLDAEQREGNQEFNNNVTLTNGGDTETATARPSHSVTYGKSLEKLLTGTNTNYQSNWEIRYNYNQIAIPENEAWIEDTLELPHEIDFISIEVYEVMVDETGNELNSKQITEGFNIVEDPEKNKYEIVFNNEITSAYKIKYKAFYKEKDFYTDSSKTIKNTVVSGSGKRAEDSHTLTEGILSKTRTVDFDNKQITWTIKITADNADISDLNIDDTFSFGTKTGTHTLIGGVDGIVVEGTKDTSYIKSLKNQDDLSKGFNINGLDIEQGKVATIVYSTKFDIKNDGTVITSGYGNSATATWTSGGDSFTLTKTSDYTPGTTTTNNGTKTGKFDYSTQRFTWQIKVNINKQDINGATLTDTLGPGQKIVDGTFRVVEYTLSNINNDTDGREEAPLDESKYTIVSTENNFTLTFADDLGNANHKVYLVEYQSEDSDNILGIESDDENFAGNEYTNEATFHTQGKTHNIGSAKVIVNNANKLIDKSVSGNSSDNTTDILKWTIDINKSRSNLEGITLTDKPSESLILLDNSIEYREETSVKSEDGTITYSDWKKPTEDMLTITTDHGFQLVLSESGNGKKAYQVRYETIALAEQGKPFSNNAKIEFSYTTSNNQKTEDSTSENFAFSSSDTSFSLTKGNVKFQKVGFDPETGEEVSLQGVNFELIKTIGKGSSARDYVMATATSMENGYFEFMNINYGTYKIKEMAAPEGYKLMNDFTFILSADNATNIDGNENKVTVVENIKDVDEANMCPQFTLTIRDVDGNLVANKEVVLKDGDREYSLTTNNEGKLVMSHTGMDAVKAGKYTVYEGEELLGETTVKYTQNDCEAELQPVNTCPLFTIKLKDNDGNARPNVIVTLKDKDGTVVKTDTTNSEGEITVPSTTKAGTYDLYEDKQFLSEVKVTYKDGCSTEVIQAPTCPEFALTVNDVNGKVLEAGVTIMIQNVDTKKELAGTTNAEGKVTFDSLEPGKYVVYGGSTTDDVTKKMGEFAVDTTCEAVVQPAPACPVFTITVKEQDGKIRPNVKITVKDSDGEIVGKDIVTNKNGEISLNTTTLKSGKYNIYENEIFLGSITVDYKLDCNVELMQAPVCPIFTLTVQNVNGNVRPNVEVNIKDSTGKKLETKDNEGNTVTTFLTDENGQIKFDNNVIKQDTYSVYEGNKLIRSFTVTDTCSATIKPIRSGGGGGGGGKNPPPKDSDDDKPTDEDEEKPTDPDGEKPTDSDGENPTDENGENPADSDGDEPTDSEGGDPADSQGGNSTNPNDEDVESANDGSNKGEANSSDTKEDYTNAEKLPQTNGESNSFVVLLGLLLVTTSIIALARRRKMA